jgi:hypothetical protein
MARAKTHQFSVQGDVLPAKKTDPHQVATVRATWRRIL